MPQPERRKTLILQAAERLMTLLGYEATATADVANAALSSVGSVTHFFGPKAHLALAVRDSVAADLTQAVAAALVGQEADVPRAIAWRCANPARAKLLKELAVI